MPVYCFSLENAPIYRGIFLSLQMPRYAPPKMPLSMPLYECPYISARGRVLRVYMRVIYGSGGDRPEQGRKRQAQKKFYHLTLFNTNCLELVWCWPYLCARNKTKPIRRVPEKLKIKAI